MLSLIAKKITDTMITGVCAVLIVAVLIRVIPGDAVDAILGEYATLDAKLSLRHNLGLDLPLLTQIGQYFNQLLHGNLGTSLLNQRPVSTLVLERLGPTFELALCGMLVASLIALPLGIIAAVKARSIFDYASVTLSLLGVSLPTFWLGPMLILIFAVTLHWLPVSERSTLSSYILPSLTLGFALASVLTRMTRNSILEVLHEDYVRTARAKGLKESRILFKHVLRNALLPVITIMSLQFGALLTGAVITEKIFDWPGLGSLMLDALSSRDYPVVQACVLIYVLTYIFVNSAADILYGVVDPRIKVNR